MLRAASAGALRCALSPRLPPAPAAVYFRRLHLAPRSSGGAYAASTALDYKTVRSRAQLSSCGCCGRQLVARSWPPPPLVLLTRRARQEASRAYIRREAARLLATMDYCDDSPHNPPREEDPPGAERGLFSFCLRISTIVCSCTAGTHAAPVTVALPVLLGPRGTPRTREWVDHEIKRFREYERDCRDGVRFQEKARWSEATSQSGEFRPAFTTALMLHVRLLCAACLVARGAQAAVALLTAASRVACHAQAQWEGLVAELDARVVEGTAGGGDDDSAKTAELKRVEEALTALFRAMTMDKYMLAAMCGLEKRTAFVKEQRERLARARSTLHLLRAYKAQHFPDALAENGADADK